MGGERRFPFTLRYNQTYIHHATTNTRRKTPYEHHPHIVLHTKLDVGLESLNIVDSAIAYDQTVKTNVHIPIEDAYNCNPDDALWYLPKHLHAQFLEFFAQYFTKNPTSFNFSNGPYGESVALCDIFTEKFLILFLDPECGSAIFTDIVEQFSQLHHLSEPYDEGPHIIHLAVKPRPSGRGYKAEDFFMV